MIQLLDSPIPHNHLLRPLVMTRLVAARRLSPGRYRIAAAGSLAFTATMRMVYRVHRHTADVRTNSAPASTPGFAQRDVLVLDIANLPHRRAAFNRNAPHLTRRHTQLRVLAFLGEQLRERSGSPRHLSAFSGTQLDVVNLRAQRNVANRQSVSGKNIGIFTAGNHLADFQSDRGNDVALLAVDISNQSNARRAIRIVFDLRYTSRHAVLVAFEIDDAIETLVTPAAPSH